MNQNRRESDPRIDSMQSKIEAIYSAILGDIDDNSRGLLARMSNAELKIKLLLYVVGVCFSAFIVKVAYALCQ